jgi:tellurite resistance protein
MQPQNRLQNMPVTFFAMVMGLAGLTVAWEKAGQIHAVNSAIAATLLVQSLTVFGLLLVLYIAKGWYFRDAMRQEWANPVRMNFVPAISISLLLFAVAFLPLSLPISRVLWIVGASMHLLISLHVINSWLHQQHFEIHHMNPAWFIPAVGNVIVPLAAVPLGYIEIAWFFFSTGMMLWLVLLVIVFNRIIFHQPLPEKLLPTLFILIAPPAVGFLSYTSLTGSVDTFALVLYNFALFLTLLLFSQFPRFVRLPFFMSWWAYSFPLAAMSIASMELGRISSNAFFAQVGLVLLLLLSVLVFMLFIKTLRAAQSGTICVPES